MKTDYERHSLSNPFGEAAQSDVEELILSMNRRGYDPEHPIVIYEGQILDGWHRYQAAKRAGVEPTFRDFHGTLEQARAFVYGENLPRRHMTQRQKITALHLMNQWLPPRERLSDAAIQARTGASSSKFTNQMRRVVENNPDAAHKVVAGEMKANEAIRNVINEVPEGVTDGPIYDAAGSRTQWTVTIKKKHLVKTADELRTELKMTEQVFINKAVELFIEWAREQSETSQTITAKSS